MAGFHRFECDIMKTETKAIVASALVVALAITAISGVTYSWFSDSEDATINVTTGTIEVDAKWSDFTLKSANIDGEKTVHIGDHDTFPYTSSTFSSAETASSGSTKISVTAFMNPGDSFEFTISDIVLKNTIKAVFNYGYEIKVVDGPEAIPFVVKHTTTDPEFNVPNITYAGSDTAREFSDNTITVTLPMDCGNEYQGCSYQMEFYIVAVQSNSPDANITQSNSGAAVHDVTAGDNVVAVSPAEGVFDSATIQFNSGSSDGKIVVKTVDSTTEGITVSDGRAILAGVDVTTGGSEHALRGTDVRITFVIDGELSENSISIYHDGAAITPSDLTVNSEDGKTTISFTTSDGFSAYYVAANYDAKVGSAYYENLADAIAGAENGSTVTILRDIDTNETFTLDKKRTIDGNGHVLTSSASYLSDGGIFNVNNGASGSAIKNLDIHATAMSGNTGYGVGICLGDDDVSLASFSLIIENVDIYATQRGVTVYSNDNSDVELTIDGCKIYAVAEGLTDYTTQVTSTGNYNNSRGISLWRLENSEVNIFDTTVAGFYYAINIADGDPASLASSGLVVNINNCELFARAAINNHVEYATFNAESCRSVGINNFGGQSESFGFIVDDSTCVGCEYNIRGCTYVAYMNETGAANEGATQYLFCNRGADTSFSVDKDWNGDRTVYVNTYGSADVEKGGIFEHIVDDETIEICGGTYTGPAGNESYNPRAYIGAGCVVSSETTDGLTTYTVSAQ